jgi:hypothetical protein
MAEQSQITGGIGGAMQGAATGSAFGPVGAVVGGVIGGALGFMGGGGEKKAKRLAREQAAQMRRTARENKRREELQAAQTVSQAKVATYASNILDTGTTRKARDFMEGEYRRQIMWDYRAGLQSARTVEKGGQAAAQQIKSAGYSQLLSGLGSAATTLAKSGWKSPWGGGGDAPEDGILQKHTTEEWTTGRF